MERITAGNWLPELRRAIEAATPRARMVAFVALELCERLEEKRAAGIPLWGVGKEIDQLRERLEKLLAGEVPPDA